MKVPDEQSWNSNQPLLGIKRNKPQANSPFGGKLEEVLAAILLPSSFFAIDPLFYF